VIALRDLTAQQVFVPQGTRGKIGNDCEVIIWDGRPQIRLCDVKFNQDWAQVNSQRDEEIEKDGQQHFYDILRTKSDKDAHDKFLEELPGPWEELVDVRADTIAIENRLPQL
jgi:hypothetical protein